MRKVTFLSPGSFVAEQSTIWVRGKMVEDTLENAVKKTEDITERQGRKMGLHILTPLYILNN